MPENLTPNPFPSGKGNQMNGDPSPTDFLTGTKSRIFSYYWVQGSPLPKEA